MCVLAYASFLVHRMDATGDTSANGRRAQAEGTQLGQGCATKMLNFLKNRRELETGAHGALPGGLSKHTSGVYSLKDHNFKYLRT